ncbi:polysaccharide pyruvyl transferase family protein [Plantibacter sp. CFBP 8804]|uniref:polysaccharide pyruvyl transferase family protein n=1 Tax=Plantibacter sp. CFBP 8804 TaxID=2775270 RepID=UPI00177D3FB8|nr:polysaccharide pyruvyl transferase family protein [Plantibacter sp. CFBP 8804]
MFVSATGQDDNIGDSVLRRAHLDFLRSFGSLHVLVGANSQDYISGLGLSAEDVQYSSPAGWRRSAAMSMLRRRTALAFNCGEIRLDSAYLKTYLGHLPLVLLSRLHGGYSLHLGYGVRQSAYRWRRTIGMMLRLTRLSSWRDSSSARLMRVGSVTPDWAFSTGQSAQQLDKGRLNSRNYLSLSMRGDRDFPPPNWFDSVLALAQVLDLEIVVVPQVRRDNRHNRELSERLGARFVPWEMENHTVRETTVRALYASSSVVVSDRLHALIIGATEGAAPVGLTVGSPEKLHRTLAVVGLQDLCFAADSMDTAQLDRAVTLVRSTPQYSAVASARAQLSTCADEVGRL